MARYGLRFGGHSSYVGTRSATQVILCLDAVSMAGNFLWVQLGPRTHCSRSADRRATRQAGVTDDGPFTICTGLAGEAFRMLASRSDCEPLLLRVKG